MCREIQVSNIRFALDDYCGQEHRDDERLQTDDLLAYLKSGIED